MGRLDGITTLVQLFFDAIGVEPQPWMGGLFGLMLALILGPSILRNIKTGQARKRIVKLADMQPDARDAFCEKILAMVDGNADGLIAVADEAMRRRQLPLARDAYVRLRVTGKRPADQLRLEEALNGPLPRHHDEEINTIERLIAAGALERARERISRAQVVFASSQELQLLDQQVQDAAAETGTSPTSAIGNSTS